MAEEKTLAELRDEAPALWRRMTHDGRDDLAMIVQLFYADGPSDVLGAHCVDEHTRDRLLYAARVKARNKNAVACAFLYEAWTADDDGTDRPPSERDDRRELLFLLIQRCEGADEAFDWEIIRSRGRARLGPRETFTPGLLSERFDVLGKHAEHLP